MVSFVLSALLGLGLTGSALAEDTGTTVANAAVTMKDGDQMQMKRSGAASVSSSSQTDESGKTTTTITVAVPNDGKVENGNTGLVTGGTVYTAVNAALSNQIGTLNANGSYIRKDDSVSSNLSKLDTQVKVNADAISANADAISTEKTDREAAVTTVTNTVSTLSDSAVKYDTGSNNGKVTLAGEGGTTITHVKDGDLSDSSTDAVTGKQLYAEQTARETKDTELSTKITSNATDITGIKTDIAGLKDLSNVSEAGKTVIKKQAKQAVKVAADGNATVTTAGSEDDGNTLTYTIHISSNGTVSLDNTGLISGGTLYSELRPEDGTYVKRDNTTAANLSALDNNLANVINAMGLDINDTKTSYTSKLNKYFKVNPEVTTSVDGKTKTYAPDAAANGTNSVAIGPSAQAGDKSTDAATSTTTITGGKSSTAIGDSAKANGDQSVALGYGSEVLNASGSTTAVSGSTAIGSSAKVEGGSDSTALGSGASVDTASGAMALGKSATINKTATSGVAIGNGAVTGSADKTITVNNLSYNVNAAGGVDSVAIGTDASNAGNTSIALGKGAMVKNDSDGNYQAVVKSDDIAVGTGAKTTASDASTAIGKGASVAQSTDALAIGSSAAVGASSNDAMALGKGAAVGSGAADSIAMGTKAKTISADTIAIGQNTSAEGANSVVIGKGAATTDEGGNAIGTGSAASGSSTAIGQSATANNYNALAIGNNAKANVDKSISLGYNAGVGTSEGKGETQNAGSLIAIGTSAGNNVSGMQNVAIGESAGSNVKSSNNIAIGTQAGYGINYASDNKTQNGYNVSIGYKANYQENAASIMYATALGNEANASNYAVAIGDGAKASGTNSLALGYSAQASDEESMALGHNASAADGNVAIGNGSLAPAVSSLGTVKDGYVYQSTTSTDSTGASTTTLTELKSAFTYKPLASDSHYISVGTTDLTRRISNVADGVFASDAATVGQLNSLNELLQATDTKVGLTKDYFEQKFTDLNTTIDVSKTHYFSISESSDNLSANKDNTGATSNKADAMAIGPNANATNVKSLAVGNNVYATGLRSIAIGTAPNPTKDAAGTTTTHNTSAEGENSIALGTSTTAQADNSIAIGTRAQTYTTDTTSKTGAGSVAIGNLATTAGNQSVALGYDATVKYDYGTAIGSEALASGTDAVAVGKGSKAYSTGSTAIGQNNTVTGSNVYGLGSSNAISGNWGSIVQSGVSGYKNTVTSVSDQDTTNALTGVYMTGSSNTLNQNVKYNVMQDITVQGSSNTIDGGAGGTSGHPNTLSQIAIVGSDNTVQGKSSDDSKTNNIKDVTILGYNNKVDANTDTTVDFSNTQILGSNVTAKLGNSVYLGSNAAYTGQTLAASDAITSARTAADAAAEASDAYKAATTDAEKAQIKAQYEAQYLYKLNVQAMEASGTTAGTQSYSTDETFGDGTSYTYAGSSPAGVVTVGSVGAERRIQNVAAGLVGATSTDAVNGSQLYALTRQIRFGGDNSSFGTTTADDKNVVARGSNETIAITGGSDAVTSSTTDGNTTYTVDTTKLTDNNIAVVADTDNEALHVQLASNLKNLNTAQLGSGSGESYKETIKLDGTGTTGGQMTLAGADGTVKTTLDTTGLTIANGPKFTSSGIDAGSQKINHVTAGTDDADAVNVKQLQSARTLLTQGTNTTLADTDADGHHTYTVNVDNLAVKANGTGTTVALANGINFKNGTNTMATVGADGTVTISASHNKLSTVSAATGDKDNVTLTLTDVDGNTVTSTGLKNTYTTVNKNGTNHTVTFARNDGTTETLSLGDLDGASKNELATAAAKATSEVTNGTNVTSVTKTTGNNNQNIYTVNVDDLAVKTTDGEKKSVHLKDGLVFADGTNTTATVGDNGTVKFNVSDNAIKKQAVNAINVTGGSNVTVTPETNADGTLKTFTVAASDLKYSANGTSKTTSLANGISFAAGSNTTAEIDNNGAIKINATHNKLNATGTATKATADSNAVTLTLNDQDGNTTTTALTDTYTTVSKDATNKKVTFKRNDGETQTLELSDLGGITEAQDKYVTGGKVTYEANGNGTASLTGNNGLTASITGLKDTKVSSGTASYLDSQGNATVTGTATLNMNDGTTATISGLKDDYITSAAVGKETNHVTMTRLGGGTVDLDLNPILGKYSLSDYHLVGAGTTHDKAYAVDSNGTVTLNVVDDKNPNGAPKTIQITGLASQSGVNAGRTTVTSSDNSVTVSDSTANSDTHTYDIKVDYSKIPGHVSLSYTGDTGSGSNTLNDSVKFAGTTNQVTTTAKDGLVTFALASDIQGINSVTTGNTTLNTNGVSNGKMNLTGTGMTITDTDASKQVSVTTSGVSMGSQRIQNVADATQDTDAATLKQVKNARTVVIAGSNVAGVDSLSEDKTTHQMTYKVNVDNLSVKSNDGTAKEVALKTGLNFKNGTNTTASVGDNGEVKYDLNSTLTGLTSVTAGNSTLDNSGLTIKEGTAARVTITGNNINMGGNVIHNVGDGVAPTDAVNKGQLEALQNQVSGGWNLVGKNSDGTAVTAKIGAGKTVTYADGTYTKSVITKDDTTGNATVKVDVTTGTFGSGTGDNAGTVTSTANGLATTQDVANAINSASISVVADDTPENKTAVKAGDTIHFAKDGNLTLVQNGTTFTYGLNPEINISKVTTSDTTKGSTVQTAEGITTTDAAGNTYIQNGQGITLTPSDKTKSPVKLTNTGLDNGGNKITGVGKGTDDTDAVNVAQLKEVNDKVGSGWQLADNDGTKVADIGAGKKVSFKTDSQYLTAKTESAGTDAANVTYGLKTKALEVADGKVSSVDTAEDGLATAKNVADTINQTYWTAASGKSGSGSWTDETANDADKKISAGDTVTFNAGNNLSLAQNGASFTYGLQADLTGMNTITFTPRNDAEGHPISLVIGKQKDGVGTDEGYYITGLDNTTWNQSNYVKDRAATEAQLADAIKQVTLASQSGGFKLSDDNDKEVSQVLGKAIGVVGDGNITTTAETTTADPNGHIKVSLKKNIDLGTDGSLQAGGVTLKNNSVTVGNNGIVISSTDSEKTVSNLSNTTWDTDKVNQEASAGGYKGSTKAATESQLAEAISTATSTASANEQHIKDGSYSVTTIDNGDGTKSQGVSIDIITGDGSKPEAVKGHVVIKDVAKASEVGTVSEIADDLKKKNGDTVQPTSVVEAINNLNDKVGDKNYSKVQGEEITDGDNTTTAIGKLNNRMNDIYQTAGQHTMVSNTDKNLEIKPTTDDKGKTNYEINLSKQVNLGNVQLDGDKGSIEAKSMKADSFTAGSIVVDKDGVKVGGNTYIDNNGLNANGNAIHNVGEGKNDTDAVNVKQVNDLAARQGEAITENAAHISELGRAVNKLDNRINRVGAGAAALAALHPGSYDPDDKLDVSAGVGNYRGANAAAVGLFFHPNERTILSVAGSMGGGENMVNAGVTLKVGPGHGTPTTVTTRTGQKVDVMDILAKQTEILEKLAGNAKAVSAPAGSDIFPDVPQNHWAYAYVDKLYRTGSLAGFSEPGKLKSHMLTRKDFAEILYWAMTNGATTNPDLNSDGSLNRLAAEFGAELKLVMR
ncbi:YadA-like family protein [Dialister succinatiphilus]|uniref:YadA-like family protein n=1 Tax=Dialister succinatiphilus TaxID=487173 RepID=UPI004024C2D8